MFTTALCIVASYLEKNKAKKDSSILNSLNMLVIKHLHNRSRSI